MKIRSYKYPEWKSHQHTHVQEPCLLPDLTRGDCQHIVLIFVIVAADSGMQVLYRLWEVRCCLVRFFGKCPCVFLSILFRYNTPMPPRQPANRPFAMLYMTARVGRQDFEELETVEGLWHCLITIFVHCKQSQNLRLWSHFVEGFRPLKLSFSLLAISNSALRGYQRSLICALFHTKSTGYQA